MNSMLEIITALKECTRISIFCYVFLFCYFVDEVHIENESVKVANYGLVNDNVHFSKVSIPKASVNNARKVEFDGK